jgi:hypothetical protein
MLMMMWEATKGAALMLRAVAVTQPSSMQIIFRMLHHKSNPTPTLCAAAAAAAAFAIAINVTKLQQPCPPKP